MRQKQRMSKKSSKTFQRISGAAGISPRRHQGIVCWEMHFLRYPKISVYINNLQIAVEGASAKVTFEAILTSGQKTGSLKDIIPQSFGIYAFDVAMKKENNGWKVISAHWEEMGVDDRKMPPAEK